MEELVKFTISADYTCTASQRDELMQALMRELSRIYIGNEISVVPSSLSVRSNVAWSVQVNKCDRQDDYPDPIEVQSGRTDLIV